MDPELAGYIVIYSLLDNSWNSCKGDWTKRLQWAGLFVLLINLLYQTWYAPQ